MKDRCALRDLRSLLFKIFAAREETKRESYGVHGLGRFHRNCARDRQQSLPVTSCLVESLIREINQRVKGPEQFWNRPTSAEGEASLQTVASLLSDGDPLTPHILHRPGGLHDRRSTTTNLAAT